MTTPDFIGHDIPCPLCQGTDLVCVGTHDRHGDKLKTDLCRWCGHVFTNPQPTQDELDAYYGESYRTSYKGVLTPKQKHVYRAGLRALERLSRLTPFVKAGDSILDIGAGGGEFVYLATQRGFTAHGIEPNRGYATFAQAEYEIPIRVGTVEDVADSAGAWHAITLHHVLEHLADPAAALKKLASMLAEGGVIVVEVPNVVARYHGPKRRFHFAHLHTFSADGLALLAGQVGLAIEDLEVQPHTGHLNIILRKTDTPETDIRPSAASDIERHLQNDTPGRDIFTARPYMRLWANLKRPIKERAVLAQLGQPESARVLLDRLYDTTD